LSSVTTARFRRAFAAPSREAQRRARSAYAAFRRDRRHPSLRFTHVHPHRPIYSARIGLGHRALGVLEGETMVWFWIGTHADYDRLLREL
jgi:hypothetical protein